MLLKKIIALLFLVSVSVTAQNKFGTISGKITSNGKPVPFTSVYIENSSLGTNANEEGDYSLNISEGKHTLIVSSQGYVLEKRNFNILSNKAIILDVEIEKDNELLNEVVITGTRTAKRRTDSPVIVNLINSETLTQVVATDLSEGLRFQPGLRVETDCQTCNYTNLELMVYKVVIHKF